MSSYYENSCIECNQRIFPGTEIFWNNDGTHQVKHASHDERRSIDNVPEEPTDPELATLEKKAKEVEAIEEELSRFGPFSSVFVERFRDR